MKLRSCGRAAVTFFIWLAAAASARSGEQLVSTVEELQAAVKDARPGDAIVMRNGVWEDADIRFDGKGTPEKPITLRAETPGEVVIRGAARLRITGRYLVVSGLLFHEAYNDDHLIVFRRNSDILAENCRLTECAIIDCNRPTDEGEPQWITLYGKRNRVDHCTAIGKTTKGTTLVAFITEEPNGHRIDHNYFGRREKLGENGGETIRIGDSETSQFSSRTVVEHNLFEQCNGEAEIISNKSCDNVYRHNTFLRCSGALTLRHGHRALVHCNYFLGDRARGSGGVRIIGTGHRVVNNYFADLEGDDSRAALSIVNGFANTPADGYEPVEDAVVAFNTFINCKETIAVGITGEGDPEVPPADCTIANNAIVPRRERQAVFIRTAPENFTWLGNLVEGEVGVEIAGVRQVDDLRLEEDGLLHHLTDSSPAIDAAVGEFEDVTEDIAGRERGEAKDAGCEERSGQPARFAPLTRQEIGTSWVHER